MSHELDRTAFAGRRAASMADLRRVIDLLVDHFRDRDENHLVIHVVPTVDDLPEGARANQWFRVAADPGNVYVGNGVTRPLSRFPLTPV